MCIALAAALACGDYGAATVYASQPEVSPVSAEQTGVIPTQPVEVSPVPVVDPTGVIPTQPVDVPSVPVVDPTGSTTTQTAADESAEPAFRELTEEELAAYYGDSVFIGDSIMLGFRNYSAKQTTFVSKIEFLAATSYSVNCALKPVKGKNIHPKYKGKKYQLWDAIPLTGKKRAFIMLGMNDLAVFGIKADTDKYKELIDKILETSPDLEIHIISVTYTLKDKGTPTLNSTSIDMYNSSLQEMANENGWSYLDFCTLLSDGEGNLAKEYCSDNFVHLTKAAYTLWESELIKYASKAVAEAEAENETAGAENINTAAAAIQSAAE